MTTRSTILITGASSGLGEGMARLFAAQGRNLALCARRLENLEALRTELLAAHPRIQVEVRALDVNDYDRVFQVFEELDQALGGLDRIIVNAGIGKGQPLGTGAFHANRQTAETNFVAALAQCEAAMQIFRRHGRGHLVVISSMSALRGMRKNITTYAASKAGVAALAEGLRSEMLGTPIKISTLYPGYIRSAINEKVKNAPFIVDTETGCKALVKAINKEPAKACVPAWPWAPLGFAMRVLPLAIVRKMT
ncbi:SDR family oxidoreductase [Alloalcanivorax mobilis]|uniref:SDR family oxidoreductase n=1 Tax=Alloalcanivorax mobilis TaxID=2019569 RepID=UPI000B5B265B|nr:SDR family oxidoreductase [Alloalcanivorax mobilis]ASK35590.1 short chain dehydrogenase [Alcanivorax sp. N3-2A]